MSSKKKLCRMKIKEKFGIVIRELRTKKGVSQEQLAYEAGIDRTYVGHIEKGSRNVSLEIIEKLANYFKMSISDLLKIVENLK